MKYYLNVFFFVFLPFLTNAQEQYHMKVARYKTGGAVIESYRIDYDFSTSTKSETLLGKNVFTAQANLSLQNYLNKGISWMKLNEQHKKSFTKELIRLRATNKETFEFYKKFIPEFSDEVKVEFSGDSDGTSKITVFVSDMPFFVTYNIVETRNLISLLQGKSINSEIDGIFK